MRPPRLDQLDDIDHNLIALLQTNARESVASLARQLGIARTTVIACMVRLEKSDVIASYGVRLGQDVLDASIQAYGGYQTRAEVRPRRAEAIRAHACDSVAVRG